MKKREILPGELKEILRLHEEWLESDGKEGVKADFSGADLSHAHFSSADFSHTHFSGADLSGANFSGADLSGALLNGANLREADLSGAVLCRAELRSTDLRGADLRGAKLSKAWFWYADLSGAKLSGVDFHEAVFDNTKLCKTDLVGTKFSEEQLSNMIFIDPGQETLEDIGEESSRIIRSIEFPPEYYQAGISILNYFGTILRDKYPDKKAKVKIEQDGLKVTMIVESDDGDIETIEKLLDNYGLVIHGKMQPEKLLDNKDEVLQLKNQLGLAQHQIEMQKEFLRFRNADVKELYSLFSQLIQKPGVQKTTNIRDTIIKANSIDMGLKQGSISTTIINNYINNKDEIDKALEDFKKEVSEEMQQQVDALTAALEDKDEKTASGAWEKITKVFTASDKAAKFTQSAADLFDKLKDFF